MVFIECIHTMSTLYALFRYNDHLIKICINNKRISITFAHLVNEIATTACAYFLNYSSPMFYKSISSSSFPFFIHVFNTRPSQCLSNSSEPGERADDDSTTKLNITLLNVPSFFQFQRFFFNFLNKQLEMNINKPPISKTT